MTLPRDPQADTELVTARVRGGRSPWLVAAVALAILGSVPNPAIFYDVLINPTIAD